MTASRSGESSTERRAHPRYPVRFPLRYLIQSGKLLSVSGEGTTVNISSTGMLFRSTKRLEHADRVVAAVQWPSATDGKRVFLFFHGHVVWMKGPQIAINISHYGFLPAEDPANMDVQKLEKLAAPGRLTPTRPHPAISNHYL
jgi:PilZ domain